MSGPALPDPLPEFAPIEIDCATAVMLKILDGKCKMNGSEKVVMEALYDALKGHSGQVLGPDLHTLIARARSGLDEVLREDVYEQRLYAETQISRPVMKGFKARLRTIGVLPAKR